jgi:hypothetical protein
MVYKPQEALLDSISFAARQINASSLATMDVEHDCIRELCQAGPSITHLNIADWPSNEVRVPVSYARGVAGE